MHSVTIKKMYLYYYIVKEGNNTEWCGDPWSLWRQDYWYASAFKRDRQPDASSRLTETELNIWEIHMWHIRPAFSQRSTDMSRTDSVLCIAARWVWTTEWKEIVTAERYSGEVNLCSTVFKPGVSAVSSSRQQNYATCRYSNGPRLLNIRVQGNL
jgi:hypothetical protein